MSSIAARLPLILNELRLPTIKRLGAGLAEQSNKEGSIRAPTCCCSGHRA